MFLPSGYHRKFKISNFSVYKAIDETTAVAQTSMTAELGGRDAAAGAVTVATSLPIILVG